MKTATIGLRISEQEKAQLEAVAAMKDIPLSQLIREAVRKYIMEDQKNERH